VTFLSSAYSEKCTEKPQCRTDTRVENCESESRGIIFIQPIETLIFGIQELNVWQTKSHLGGFLDHLSRAKPFSVVVESAV
jgi:hypothetical protein